MLLKPTRDVLTNHSLQPVSLERVKEQLRILDDDEDSLLLGYIESATSYLEEWTGYYMMPALVTAYFNYCSNSCLSYLMDRRPFNSISTVEVKVDGTYTLVDSADYTLQEFDWDAHLCIESSVEIDSQCSFNSGNCPDVIEPVKIAYNTGEYRTVNIVSITVVGQTATVVTDAPHGLKTNDQVIISSSGEDDLDGVFTSILVSATSFSYTVLGTPANVVTGLVTIPEIPPQLLLAVMQMVAKMYNNRGDCCDKCGSVPCGAQSLASQFKRVIIRSSKRVRNDCLCG